MRISLSQAFLLLYITYEAGPVGGDTTSDDVGVFHQAIFANMLGCFLMGILVQFKSSHFFQRY